MNPLTMSARYAAFLWFNEQQENANKTQADAHAFALANWKVFLPLADIGWGRLLVRLARSRRRKLAAPQFASCVSA